jgi:hypothetical protein
MYSYINQNSDIHVYTTCSIGMVGGLLRSLYRQPSALLIGQVREGTERFRQSEWAGFELLRSMCRAGSKF